MKLILDASVAVHVALRGELAHAQLIPALEQATQVLSPQLIQAEVANALWKLHRFQGLSLADAQAHFEVAMALIDTFVPDGELVPQAMRLAAERAHPVYDMLYVAAALHHGAQVLSLDKKLIALCNQVSPRLAWEPIFEAGR